MDTANPDHQHLLRDSFDEDNSARHGSTAQSSSSASKDSGLSPSRRPTHYDLYASHFLSTWNSRVFEFGSVLYLASIFPGDLLPMSCYALFRGLAALLFASSIGRHIDGTERLRCVRQSIVGERFSVALSCAVFYLMAQWDNNLSLHNHHVLVLVVLTLLACVEKLCSIMNMVSIEKDWVIVIAASDDEALAELNAQMRRIDLACKLLGPLFIASLDAVSTRTAILANLCMNMLSIPVEYWCIAKVYNHHVELQIFKQREESQSDYDQLISDFHAGFFSRLARAFDTIASDFAFYFRHEAFLVSFACTCLYFTVLSFGGQMVTYLLSVGLTSVTIGCARAIAVAFEVSATFLAPPLFAKFGPLRPGLWFLSSQFICLAAGFTVFFVLAKVGYSQASAWALVVATALSRLGLRGFDLSAQILVQNEVEAGSRGTFSAVEAALQSGFEVCSFLATIVFRRPEQFKWPSLFSILAVLAACVLYSAFVRKRRGHLLHLDKLPFPLLDWEKVAFKGADYTTIGETS